MWIDRKSTRLNSSHTVSSYAVFCLKKKKRRTTARRGWTRCPCRRGRPCGGRVSTSGRATWWSRRALCCCRVFFFFNDTATTEIYTLSLHDALPISYGGVVVRGDDVVVIVPRGRR